MTGFRVVLDACVMIPQTLNDLLLTLADAELYQPVWSADLLDEVERNLIRKLHKSAEQASRRVAQMRKAFPFAEEESRGYRELVPAMTNDPKDRHVLATAVSSAAGLIVTANLKDFPESALVPFGVEAIHPDEFLCDQLDLDPGAVLECMGVQVGRNRRPPQTLGELLESLEALTPRFVEAVRAQLSAPDEVSLAAESTLPIVSLPVLTDEEIEQLEPDVREWYNRLRTMSRVDRARLHGHMPVVTAAWGFLTPACVDGDLKSVWPKVHPDLRSAWAHKWVQDNRLAIDRDGWDAGDVARALAEPESDHSLWVHFERVHVRGLRAVLPPPATWGIGAETRMVSPDVEVLYLHDRSTLEGGEWMPGEERWIFPLLMCLVDGDWLVLNLGSEDDPAVTYAAGR